MLLSTTDGQHYVGLTRTLLKKAESGVRPDLEEGGVLVVSVQHRDGEESPAGEGRGALVPGLGWGREGCMEVVM